MNLKQAFTEWAAIPQNTVLAAKCRSAVNAVLLKKYSEEDVRSFSSSKVRNIMERCLEPQAFKTQSASLLVSILSYAAGKGFCEVPDFDFTIANSKIKKEETTQDTQKEYPTRFKPGHVPYSKGKTWDEIMSKEKQENCKKGWKNLEGKTGYHAPNSGRPKVPVLQLHPETLKVVARYDSMSDAVQAFPNSKGNLSRAIKVRGMTSGFYWCLEGDEKNFSPGRRRKIIKKEKTPVKEKLAKVHEAIQDVLEKPKQSLSDFTVEQLRDELKERGWYGTLYKRLDF